VILTSLSIIYMSENYTTMEIHAGLQTSPDYQFGVFS